VNLRAVAQAAYQASEQLSFSFGAVLSYDFGQLLPLPHLDLCRTPTWIGNRPAGTGTTPRNP